MPDVVYSPTQGRVSNVSAEEKLAQDARDFLFRQQLAQAQQMNESRRMAQADQAMTAQERMNAANLAAQRDIQGDFQSRTGAARDLQAMAGTQAKDLESMRGSNALKQTQMSITPQFRALGLDERKYNDSQNTLDKALERKAMGIMGLGESAAPSGARAGIGRTSSGSTPGPAMGDGDPAVEPIDASPEDEIAVQPALQAAAKSKFIVPGKNQYQFDDKSSRDIASMLSQLKGQVSDKGMGEAQDMLANSNRQLAERKAAEAERVKAELLKASIPQGQQYSAPMEGSPQGPLPLPGQSMRLPGIGAAQPTSQAADPQTKILMDAITRKLGGKTDDMRREESIAALRQSPNPDDQAMALKMLVDPTFQPDFSNVGKPSPVTKMQRDIAERSALAQFTPDVVAGKIDTKDLEDFLSSQWVNFSSGDKSKLNSAWSNIALQLKESGADDQTIAKAKEMVKNRLAQAASQATMFGMKPWSSAQDAVAGLQ